MFKNIILAMLLVSSSLFSADVNWAKDYDSGLKKAQKEDKPVLFIISRDTCKYCVMLDNQTLKDKQIVKALNKDFVAIRSWTNEGDYIPDELARYTPGLPGIWFLTPKGEPIFKPMLGFIKKDKFIEILAIVHTEYENEKKENEKKGKK